MYPLGTWFVSGICVWLPCIKETMMMMMMIIIIMKMNSPQTKNIITKSKDSGPKKPYTVDTCMTPANIM